jgi:ethanolamine ammonia-lyase small subunit
VVKLAAEPNDSTVPGLRERSRDASDVPENDLPDIVRKVRARTPARLLTGRAGTSYKTDTQMTLREAHAAARDAVRTELNLKDDFDPSLMMRWNLFEVCTRAANKHEYLLRPDLGRQFNPESRGEITRRCSVGKDLQIVIGDGLSVTALHTQVPQLLPLLFDGATSRGWSVGQIFVVRHCRVGILNEIGALLAPKVAVLLIGERPGLATAESLSAYMAYRPEVGHTDADRNLISNIHSRGVSPQHAAARILNLGAQMMAEKKSGYTLSVQSSAREAKVITDPYAGLCSDF